MLAAVGGCFTDSAVHCQNPYTMAPEKQQKNQTM
jgi:hypothetical protein